MTSTFRLTWRFFSSDVGIDGAVTTASQESQMIPRADSMIHHQVIADDHLMMLVRLSHPDVIWAIDVWTHRLNTAELSDYFAAFAIMENHFGKDVAAQQRHFRTQIALHNASINAWNQAAVAARIAKYSDIPTIRDCYDRMIWEIVWKRQLDHDDK